MRTIVTGTIVTPTAAGMWIGIDVPTTETQGSLILHLLLIRACDAAAQIFTALE